MTEGRWRLRLKSTAFCVQQSVVRPMGGVAPMRKSLAVSFAVVLGVGLVASTVAASLRPAPGRPFAGLISVNSREIQVESNTVQPTVSKADTGVSSGAAATLAGAFTVRSSLSGSGVQANAGSGQPAISSDGRFVAFASDASNLVPGDTNMATDVFVRDRRTGATTRVSVSTAGEEGDRTSNAPSISGDGRFVTFVSDASNLVAGDTNNHTDVFIRDRRAGITKRVSVSTSLVQANDQSSGARITPDGRFVTFVSSASNLVAGDTDGLPISSCGTG